MTTFKYDSKDFDNDLGQSNSFLLWQLEEVRDGDKVKAGKVPYSVKTGRPCDPTNRSNGVSLALAIAAHDSSLALTPGADTTKVLDRRGVGFIIDTPFIGWDLDGCLDENGGLDDRARDFFSQFPPTWTEISQSGRGLKGFYHGENLREKLPKPCYGRKIEPNEVYSKRRFFALTGRRFPGTPLEVTRIDTNVVENIFHWVETHGTKSTTKKSVGRPRTRLTRDERINLCMKGQWQEAANTTDLSNAVFDFLYWLTLQHRGDMTKVEADFLESETCTKTHWATKWPRLRENELQKAAERAKPLLEAIFLEGGKLVENVLRSEQVLVNDESLSYFSRRGDLVKPIWQHRDLPGLRRDRRSVIIQPAEGETIIFDLASRAKYMKITREGPVPADPPLELANHIIDRVRMGESSFRPLDMVTTSPVLAPDGNVLTEPGTYHQGVLFPHIQSTAQVQPIPQKLNRDVAVGSLRMIDRILCEFPFVLDGAETWRESPSLAVVISAILSLVARPAIATVPIHAFSAPSFGAGKTKLAEIASIVALGWTASTHSFESAEEFAKALVPILRQGDRSVLIDNIRGVLCGDRFAATVSSEETEQRILGQSHVVRLLNRTVFMATGVNLVIGEDLCRRSVLCSLDPNHEHPERREFDFDSVELARKLHPTMCLRALTALRAYIEADYPRKSKRPFLGSFEEWDRLVVGTLLWCGYGDPVSTQKVVHGNDPLKQRNQELFIAWWNTYGEENPVTLKKIAENENPVRRALTDGNGGQWDVWKAAYRLQKLENQIISGLKMCICPGRRASYYLRVVNQEEADQLLVGEETQQEISAGEIRI
jgi:hypothetical protein